MHIPPMRPTFELTLPIQRDDALRRLHDLLEHDDNFRGSGVGHHVMISVPAHDRHFWSPWLNIEVHEDDGGTKIGGRFSPSPAVWTGFMMTWIGIGTLAFFVVMFGVSQWVMDKPPSSLRYLVLLGVLAAVLYWVSQVGQRLAHDQMHTLYDRMSSALTGTATPSAAITQEPTTEPTP